MKIYTSKFDLAKPSAKQIAIPSYSDFGLAIKILKDGDDFEVEFTLENNGQAITPEDNKIDGYTIYTLNSGVVGTVVYKVKCQGQSFASGSSSSPAESPPRQLLSVFSIPQEWSQSHKNKAL